MPCNPWGTQGIVRDRIPKWTHSQDPCKLTPVSFLLKYFPYFVSICNLDDIPLKTSLLIGRRKRRSCHKSVFLWRRDLLPGLTSKPTKRCNSDFVLIRDQDLLVPMTSGGTIGTLSAHLPASAVIFRETPSTYDFKWLVFWFLWSMSNSFRHVAPRRQYVVNLSAPVDIEVSMSIGDWHVLDVSFPPIHDSLYYPPGLQWWTSRSSRRHCVPSRGPRGQGPSVSLS